MLRMGDNLADDVENGWADGGRASSVGGIRSIEAQASIIAACNVVAFHAHHVECEKLAAMQDLL